MSELLQPAAGETGRLSRSRRIVVKIGSSLLVADGQLKRDWLAALCDDLQMLAKAGAELIVVSSGAIALGRGVLGLAPGPLRKGPHLPGGRYQSPSASSWHAAGRYAHSHLPERDGSD